MGSGPGTNKGTGISFYTDLPGDVKLAHISISGVEVSGFELGISIGGWNGRSGFREVVIAGVKIHHNRDAGIQTYGKNMFANADVVIRDSQAYRNSGNPSAMRNSGSGIVLGSVDGGTIERSDAFGNGWLHGLESEGPIGISAYDSRNIVIQHNRSFRNRTGSGTEGGGFEFDQNVSSSIMQYNQSYQNHGAGYLLAQLTGLKGNVGNVVQFNLTTNDGRKSGFAGLQLYGAVSNARFANNVVRMTAARHGQPVAFRIDCARDKQELTVSGISIESNIFLGTRKVDAVRMDRNYANAKVHFKRNAYIDFSCNSVSSRVLSSH